MGLISWVTATTKKAQAASLIQQYFEMLKQQGSFSADPAATANKLVELACNRVPTLPDNRKGFVLAASVLSIVVMETEFPVESRDFMAMALAGMLRAAKEERHLHSYEDQNMLAVAQGVYAAFREEFPAAPYEPPPAASAPQPEPEAVAEPEPLSGRDRQRAMDDLIKRMKA